MLVEKLAYKGTVAALNPQVSWENTVQLNSQIILHLQCSTWTLLCQYL